MWLRNVQPRSVQEAWQLCPQGAWLLWYTHQVYELSYEGEADPNLFYSSIKKSLAKLLSVYYHRQGLQPLRDVMQDYASDRFMSRLTYAVRVITALHTIAKSNPDTAVLVTHDPLLEAAALERGDFCLRNLRDACLRNTKNAYIPHSRLDCDGWDSAINMLDSSVTSQVNTLILAKFSANDVRKHIPFAPAPFPGSKLARELVKFCTP